MHLVHKEDTEEENIKETINDNKPYTNQNHIPKKNLPEERIENEIIIQEEDNTVELLIKMKIKISITKMISDKIMTFFTETESDNQTDVHQLINLEDFNEKEQTDYTQQNNGDNTNQDLDQNNELNAMKESNINWYTTVVAQSKHEKDIEIGLSLLHQKCGWRNTEEK